MRIVFIRHGKPDYKTDTLTDLGKLHALEVAERVKDLGIKRIFTSSMGRAIQTAAPTEKLLGIKAEIIPFMHEISWGSRDEEEIELGGHPWLYASALVGKGSEAIYREDWKESPEFIKNKVSDAVSLVEKKGDEWLASLGYCREGAYYRVTEEDNDKTIAVFSHGGSSTALIAHMLNIPFPAMCLILRPWFGAITILKLPFEKGALVTPTVEIMSDARHCVRE